MRNLILAAALGAVGLTAMPAEAQRYGHYNRHYRHDIRDARQDCRRDLRRADNRWEYRAAQRECRRDLRRAHQRARWWDGHHWRYR
jgi:hypothetical protein